MNQGIEKFGFHGNAREWFGIWIVNLLLSIVTIGIYSAWAKVRTKKYFYQNTWVAGRNFDYHATGKQILIGRLIVVAAVAILSVLSTATPVVALLLVIALFFLSPVLIVRGAAFNARNSSWANVRFDFDGKTGQAYLIYLLYPILTVLSLYLAFPFLARATQRYGVSGHSLGTSRFHFESTIAPFYKAFLAAAVPALLGGVAFVVIARDAFAAITGDGTPTPGAVVSVTVGYLVLLFMSVMAGVLYQAMIRNHIFACTKLGAAQHGFRSTVTVGRLLWLVSTNAVLVLVSLGLLLPWTQVRMHRYLAGQTALLANGSLDDFRGDIIPDADAIGDAYADVEGVDLGLAI
ncbi:MAG: YjgN family protein [Pseudomonadota bacterium]